MQHWLHANTSTLAEAGFHYPLEIAAFGVPKHQSIVTDLRAGRCNSLRRYISQARDKTLLLSTEGMTNHLYDFPAAGLKKFSKALSGRRLTAFVVLREPRAWLRSYYIQAILNPRIPDVDYYATALTLDEFARHPRVIALLDQPQLTADLAHRLGCNVVVAQYEADWLGRFCSAFSIPISQTEIPHANKSPPRWFIELMRQFNASGMADSKRFAWQGLVQRMTRGSHTMMRDATEQAMEEGAELSDLLLVKPGHQDEFELAAEQIDRLLDFVRADQDAVVPA
ncbi:hypothetical protein EV667_4220 [Ancylobacter aquaticus]|uniref:Sulfotransferase family protein n=1 Tax=Ancylobacter aquaticus TaxID=100 RepID=A0A4R1HQY2_ANCAQ|nr:hypothetical protein [Ancylobacter aquaticus]TCK19762.1 hypothetical protein EV667_4220 [Ancylobacter aquaticus]